MNKKVVISTVSILSSLAFMAGATFAFFSDTATSTQNTFSTGTLSLAISDADQTDQESITASFGSGSLVPGVCTDVQTLKIKNTGSIAADHAEVAIENSVTDFGDNASVDMDSFLRIASLTYDGSDVLSQITDSNSNSFVDLADWDASVSALDNLSLTDLNTDHELSMKVCLDESAGNAIQGDSVQTTVTVNLNQNSSQ